MRASTTQPINNTHEAQFLAPETHQRAGVESPTTKLRIAQFRDAVDTLNWNRRDLSGATRAEYLRMDVKARLEPLIATVEEMIPQVHVRFAADLIHARTSIEYAQKTIAHWVSYQTTNQEG